MFLGADPAAPPTAQSAILQALQIATPIAQQRFGTPATQTVINTIPVMNPNTYQPAPKKPWVPWAIGGGALLLGATLLFAIRRRSRK
jgi:hypothetical protein